MSSSQNTRLLGGIAFSQDGNVGIGTAFATHRLHIYTSSNADNAYEAASVFLQNATAGEAGFALQTGATGSNIWVMGLNSNSDRFQIGYGSQASQINPANATLTLLPSGNVGIGSSTPVQLLDVNGNIRFTGDLYKGSTIWTGSQWISSGANIFFNTNNGNVGIGTNNPSAKTHILHTGAGAAFRIDDDSTDTTPFIVAEDGKVGVGTVAPLALLHVNGDVLARTLTLDTSSTYRRTFTANTNDPIMISVPYTGRPNTFFTTTARVVAHGVAANGSVPVFLDYTGQASTWDVTSLFSTIQKVQRYNVVINCCNVPVSVNSGTCFIQLDSTDAFSDTIRWNIDVGLSANNTGVSFNGGALATQPGAVVVESDLFTSSDVTFGGSIGIGTISPSHKLHLYTNNHTNNTYESAGMLLENAGTGEVGIAMRTSIMGTNAWVMGINSNQSRLDIGYGAQISQLSDADTNVTVLTNGNVGVGTTNPAFRLQVAGVVAPSACNVYDLGTSSFRWRDLYLSGNTIDMEGATITKNALGGIRVNGPVIGTEFRVAGGSLVSSQWSSSPNTVFLEGSNVGIGTVNPTHRLHVYSTSTLNNDYESASLFLENAATGEAALAIRAGAIPATSNWFIGVNSNQTRLDIGYGLRDNQLSDDSVDVTILTNGNVGIGSTNPQSMLHIHNAVSNYAAINVQNQGVLDFGFGVSGREANAGKIAYNAAWDTTALSIIGSGTSGSTRKVRMWDMTGIGTNPTYTLDVNGTTRTSKLLVNNTFTNFDINLALTAKIGNTGIDRGHIAWTRNGFDIEMLAGNLIFRTDALGNIASERMRIASSGNVGIGTDTPTHKLHVFSSSTSNNDYESAGILLENASTGEAALAIRAGAIPNTSNWFIGVNSNQTRLDIGYGLQANQLEDAAVDMTILANGYVGIGITLPTTKLQVEGTLKVGDAGNAVDAIYIQSTNPYRLWNSATALWLQNDDSSKRTAFNLANKNAGGTNEVAFQVNGKGISAADSESLYVGWTSAEYQIRTVKTGNGTNHNLNLGTPLYPYQTVLHREGNVGIGIQSPTSKLHVDGTITATSYANLPVASTTGAGIVQLSDSINTENSTLAATATAVRTAYNLAAGALPSSGGVINGNLLVSNTITTSNLNVIGTVTTINTLTTQTSNFSICNILGGGPALSVTQKSVGNGTIAEFYDVDVSTSVPVFIIADGGNVGIGTNNPLAKTHIFHSGDGDILRIDDEASPDTSPFLIKQDGNVGIGTANPLTALHVQRHAMSYGSYTPNGRTSLVVGPGSSGGAIVEIISPATGQAEVWLGTPADPTLGRVRYETAINSLSLWTSKAQQVTISNGGFVGIGTITPTAILHAHRPAIGATVNSTNTLLRLQSSNDNQHYLNTNEVRHTAGGNWTGVATRIQRFVDTSPQAYIEFNPIGAGHGAGGDCGIAFGNGAGELLRIMANGYVGIGSTSPSHKLHIYSSSITDNSYEDTSILLDNATSGETAIALRNANTLSNIWFIGLNSNQSRLDIGYGSQGVQLNNNSAFVSFSPSGNVGIGSLSPSSTLDVVGNSIRLTNSSSGGTANLTVSGNSNGIGVITVEGRQTGITAVPSYIELYKNDAYLASGLYIRNRTSQTNEKWFAGYPFNLAYNTNAYQIGYTNSANDPAYDTYSLLTVKSSGNVGIGTQTPNYRLHVRGVASLGQADSGTTTGLEGGPFFLQQAWDDKKETHTLTYPGYCVGDNSSGSLCIQASNKATTGTRKMGNMQLSFLKQEGAAVVIFEVFSHMSTGFTTFTASASGNNIVVTTDNDCAISWTSTGSR